MGRILYSNSRCCFFSPQLITSLVAHTVKHLPTMQETWVQSLDREDLEQAMAPHSSTLAWKIPWTEEPGRLQSMGSQSQIRLSDFTFFLSLSFLIWDILYKQGLHEVSFSLYKQKIQN